MRISGVFLITSLAAIGPACGGLFVLLIWLLLSCLVFTGCSTGDTPSLPTASGSPELLLSWGKQGSGNGEFWYPRGMAIDRAGTIYVTDSWNHRVQAFDQSGRFLRAWGTRGSEDGQFLIPNSIAVDGDRVYVVDRQNNRIQQFDRKGEFQNKWGGTFGTGPGEFNNPQGICVDSQHNVYVADMVNFRVQKFDYSGVFIRSWGSRGVGDGQFQHPNEVAYHPSGFLVVSDSNNDRVQMFLPSGAFVAAVTPKGCALADQVRCLKDPPLDYPDEIAFDSNGNVYIVDPNNHRIQILSPTGEALLVWGSVGQGQGEFTWPSGIAIDANDRIYVADRHRVQKFQAARLPN